MYDILKTHGAILPPFLAVILLVGNIVGGHAFDHPIPTAKVFGDVTQLAGVLRVVTQVGRKLSG